MSSPRALYEHFVHISLHRDQRTKELKYEVFRHVGFGLEIPKDVMWFCFPDQQYVAQSKEKLGLFYCFVLTDIAGNRMYGFCRRVTPPRSEATDSEFRYPHVLCLISYWPWFEVFGQLLELIEECSFVERAHLSLQALLDAIRNHPIPPPGRPLERIPFPTTELQLRMKKLVVPPSQEQSPLHGLGPHELLEALSVDNIILIFVALLCERRILLTSSNLARLSACIHSAVSLLYPFEWHHIFIPIIPKTMLDYCTAPMPFIIGAHTSAIPDIRKKPLSKVFFVDLDTNSISPADPADEHLLPSSLFKWLSNTISSITTQYLKNKKNLNADSLTQAFQFTLFHMVVGYWNFFGRNNRGLFRFDKETFILKKSKDMRPLLEHFCDSQMFERWIVPREKLAETSVIPKDSFEAELRAFAKQFPMLEVSLSTPTQTKTTVKDRLLASYNKQKKKYLAAQAQKGATPRELSKPTAVSAASQLVISQPSAFRHEQGLEAASFHHPTGATTLRPKRVEYSLAADPLTGLSSASSSSSSSSSSPYGSPGGGADGSPSAPMTQHPIMRHRIRDPEKICFSILHTAFKPSSPPTANPLFSSSLAYPEHSACLPPTRPTTFTAALPKPTAAAPGQPSSSIPAPPRKNLPALPHASPLRPGVPHASHLPNTHGVPASSHIAAASHLAPATAAGAPSHSYGLTTSGGPPHLSPSGSPALSISGSHSPSVLTSSSPSPTRAFPSPTIPTHLSPPDQHRPAPLPPTAPAASVSSSGVAESLRPTRPAPLPPTDLLSGDLFPAVPSSQAGLARPSSEGDGFAISFPKTFQVGASGAAPAGPAASASTGPLFHQFSLLQPTPMGSAFPAAGGAASKIDEFCDFQGPSAGGQSPEFLLPTATPTSSSSPSLPSTSTAFPFPSTTTSYPASSLPAASTTASLAATSLASNPLSKSGGSLPPTHFPSYSAALPLAPTAAPSTTMSPTAPAVGTATAQPPTAAGFYQPGTPSSAVRGFTPFPGTTPTGFPSTGFPSSAPAGTTAIPNGSGAAFPASTAFPTMSGFPGASTPFTSAFPSTATFPSSAAPFPSTAAFPSSSSSATGFPSTPVTATGFPSTSATGFAPTPTAGTSFPATIPTTAGFAPSAFPSTAAGAYGSTATFSPATATTTPGFPGSSGAAFTTVPAAGGALLRPSGAAGPPLTSSDPNLFRSVAPGATAAPGAQLRPNDPFSGFGDLYRDMMQANRFSSS